MTERNPAHTIQNTLLQLERMCDLGTIRCIWNWLNSKERAKQFIECRKQPEVKRALRQVVNIELPPEQWFNELHPHLQQQQQQQQPTQDVPGIMQRCHIMQDIRPFQQPAIFSEPHALDHRGIWINSTNVEMDGTKINQLVFLEPNNGGRAQYPEVKRQIQSLCSELKIYAGADPESDNTTKNAELLQFIFNIINKLDRQEVRDFGNNIPENYKANFNIVIHRETTIPTQENPLNRSLSLLCTDDDLEELIGQAEDGETLPLKDYCKRSIFDALLINYGINRAGLKYANININIHI